MPLYIKTSDISHTVMSLLEVSYLIEVPLKESANCQKIVAPPQNRSTPALAATAWSTDDGLESRLLVWPS